MRKHGEQPSPRTPADASAHDGHRGKSDDLFLGRHEVELLTGAKRKRRQCEVLAKNGIWHAINAAGWPVVPRKAIQDPARTARAPSAWSSAAVPRRS